MCAQLYCLRQTHSLFFSHLCNNPVRKALIFSFYRWGKWSSLQFKKFIYNRQLIGTRVGMYFYTTIVATGGSINIYWNHRFILRGLQPQFLFLASAYSQHISRILESEDILKDCNTQPCTMPPPLEKTILELISFVWMTQVRHILSHPVSGFSPFFLTIPTSLTPSSKFINLFS